MHYALLIKKVIRRMLLYILLIAIFGIGAWFIYNKFAKKSNTWAGVPIDGVSSIESASSGGSGNYNPEVITEINTPKGKDFTEDIDIINKR